MARVFERSGTVVYSERWPKVFDGMAPEGWCDETWYRLVNNAQVFKMDGVPNGTAEGIVRATEMAVDWSCLMGPSTGLWMERESLSENFTPTPLHLHCIRACNARVGTPTRTVP